MTSPTPRARHVLTGDFSAGNQFTDEVERALLALIAARDRRAMEQLYILYFSRLARFFEDMTLRADLVGELINDTMLQVWKESASINTDSSVLLAIMRVAYARVQKHFTEMSTEERHSRRNTQDTSTLLTATDTPSELQILLYSLSLEQRAAIHFAWAMACSRQETAKTIKITCDCVDVLLRDALASAKLQFGLRLEYTGSSTERPG
jgi:DNA-directed RNA polymerase specialized sigma24 family protein